MLRKIRSFRPRLLRQKYTWFRIFLVGSIIATTIAVWPAAECAFGQCGDRDQWCNGDCSQTCQPSTRLRVVNSCTAQAGICRDTNITRSAVRCSDASNCNVTSVVSGQNQLFMRGGYSYWDVQTCVRTPPCGSPVSRVTRVDCCTAGSIDPGVTPDPRPCTSTYQPPAVILAGHTPPYPLVIGQDPDEIGFDATVTATGGIRSNSCDRGPDQQELTNIVLESLSLSAPSRSWIMGELAQIYPGAHVKDAYPQWPNHTVNINGVNGSLVFHHDPLDPGLYDVVVVATQADGQTTRVTLQIPTYLLEATIVH